MSLDGNPLLRVTDAGLFCEQGAFYIDPWLPVECAVITHAHADHLRYGCGKYLVAHDAALVTRARLDENAVVDTIPNGRPREINGVRLSLHPAGHVLGSAQIRVEFKGQVWVVSGDDKTDPDCTSQPFEPLRCHVFVSECTFGLPIYRWPAPDDVFTEIRRWWQANCSEGRASLLDAYALGKAQRLLGGPFRATQQTQICRALSTHMVRWRHLTGPIERQGLNYPSPLMSAMPAQQLTGQRRSSLCRSWQWHPWATCASGQRPRHSPPDGCAFEAHADAGLLTVVLSSPTTWIGLGYLLLLTPPVQKRSHWTHGYTSVSLAGCVNKARKAQVVTTLYEGERDDVPEQADKPLPDAIPLPSTTPLFNAFLPEIESHESLY